MTREDIEQKVKAFLVDDFEIDAEKLLPDARLKEDLGIDSLVIVDIVVDVQRTFGFKVQRKDLDPVKTLADFYTYIEEKTK